ncbi:MAG: hypothetical protein RR343_05020 [Oscillospiraceae bacterium]
MIYDIENKTYIVEDEPILKIEVPKEEPSIEQRVEAIEGAIADIAIAQIGGTKNV